MTIDDRRGRDPEAIEAEASEIKAAEAALAAGLAQLAEALKEATAEVLSLIHI